MSPGTLVRKGALTVAETRKKFIRNTEKLTKKKTKTEVLLYLGETIF